MVKDTETIRRLAGLALNPFSDNFLLLNPLKISENLRFSDVFRGIEVKHWLKMGERVKMNVEYQCLLYIC